MNVSLEVKAFHLQQAGIARNIRLAHQRSHCVRYQSVYERKDIERTFK
jgi:hypothetical protein